MNRVFYYRSSFTPLPQNKGVYRNESQIRYIVVSAIMAGQYNYGYQYAELHQREVTKTCPNYYLDMSNFRVCSVPEWYAPKIIDPNVCDRSNPKGAHYWGQAKNENSIYLVVVNRTADKLINQPFTAIVQMIQTCMRKYGVGKTRIIRPFDIDGSQADDYFVRNEEAWQEIRANLDLPRTYITTRKGVAVLDKPSKDANILVRLPNRNRVLLDFVRVHDHKFYGRHLYTKTWLHMKYLKTEAELAKRKMKNNPEIELTKKEKRSIDYDYRIMFPGGTIIDKHHLVGRKAKKKPRGKKKWSTYESRTEHRARIEQERLAKENQTDQ